MSAAVECAEVREEKLAPGVTPPVSEQAPAEAALAGPEPGVFWGDRLAVRLWFAGAIILALLHFVEWVYRALRS